MHLYRNERRGIVSFNVMLSNHLSQGKAWAGDRGSSAVIREEYPPKRAAIDGLLEQPYLQAP